MLLFAVIVTKSDDFAHSMKNMSETNVSGTSTYSFKGYPFQVELGNNSEIKTRRFPGDAN
jgi:hypothetical protein